jgi:hypothetical protein
VIDEKEKEAPSRSQARKNIVVPICVALAMIGGAYVAGRSGNEAGVYKNDFNVYYFAATETLSRHNPYAKSIGAWTPYIYPPLLAELLVPLALLPVRIAAFLWYLVNLASLLAAAWMTQRLTSSERRPDYGLSDISSSPSPDPYFGLAAVVSLLVIGRFALDSLAMGQVNLVVVFLAVAHIYLYAEEKPRIAALALALAAVIKMTPILLVAYHAARGRIRYAVLCLLLTVMITAASFGVLGKEAGSASRLFYHQTIENGQGYDLAFSGNQSIRGAELRVLDWATPLTGGTREDRDRRTADLLSGLISLALIAIAAWKARSASTEASAAAPFFCLMVMISPLSWKNHFVMALLPAAVVFGRGLLSDRVFGKCVWAALALVFIGFTLPSGSIIGPTGAQWVDYHSVTLAAIFVLFALSVLPDHGLSSLTSSCEPEIERTDGNLGRRL